MTRAFRGEVTIVDCSIREVFAEDTDDLIFRLRRSIELTEKHCEVCQIGLGTGPNQMKASKAKPSWCFECSMMRDDLTAEEVL